ncbi:pilus assembly PilX family protein [Legionella septentrionalis]|uniref:Pilus assembly protein PilX n=1 Tax=Legionella septentrionalis TaxID=2498109 RepID=A0A3S0VB41_9GAMM|nr:PilX N-terminal domain-containing pilus assembly protein [Legionella septentrionalis]RUQ89034.1 hypothetical protein EKM59_04355 [Legionella septentrionalis]
MKKQSGATLAITLILLFLVTLLGITAMQVTHMQEKMSANLQDKELSFNAAESALAAGEAWILGLTRQPSVQTTCSLFPCVQENYQDIIFKDQSVSWWQENSAAYASPLDNIATPPRYFIEFLQFVPDSPTVGSSSAKSTGTFYYQITTRGTGASDNSVSILQSTVGRRF